MQHLSSFEWSGKTLVWSSTVKRSGRCQRSTTSITTAKWTTGASATSSICRLMQSRWTSIHDARNWSLENCTLLFYCRFYWKLYIQLDLQRLLNQMMLVMQGVKGFSWSEIVICRSACDDSLFFCDFAYSLGSSRSLRPLSPDSEKYMEQLLRRLQTFYQRRGIFLRVLCRDFDAHKTGIITESQARSLPKN